MNEDDIQKLIRWANENGYNIRERTHPKTRRNWDKPARGKHK